MVVRMWESVIGLRAPSLFVLWLRENASAQTWQALPRKRVRALTRAAWKWSLYMAETQRTFLRVAKIPLLRPVPASFQCVCVFITAGPITKLFVGGEEESGGHVL
jgi:hypothetical protein